MEKRGDFNTFGATDDERIVWIPFAKVSHDDELVWRSDRLGEFTVEGAYKFI